MTALDPDRPLLLDVMLGKLAVYLRMCGLDAAYAGDRGVEADAALLRIADAEDRVILSRDAELVDRATEAVLLTRREVDDQLDELKDVGLTLELSDPPTRCGRCNGRLVPEAPNASRPDYAPEDPSVECYRCRACGQYFWKGSHWDAVGEVL